MYHVACTGKNAAIGLWSVCCGSESAASEANVSDYFFLVGFGRLYRKNGEQCQGRLLTSSESVLAQRLWRKSGNPFRRERKSGSEDNKLWQRGAGLHLDCSGTGTRLRADAIAVFSLLRSTARAAGRDEGEKCVGDDLSTALPHTVAVK